MVGETGLSRYLHGNAVYVWAWHNGRDVLSHYFSLFFFIKRSTMFHMRVGFFFCLEVLYELCMLRGRGSCHIEREVATFEARPGAGIMEDSYIVGIRYPASFLFTIPLCLVARGSGNEFVRLCI